MNSTSESPWLAVGLCQPKTSFTSAKANACRGAPMKIDF